jgi:hypothetical protein
VGFNTKEKVMSGIRLALAIAALSICITGFSSVASAELYRYDDENGERHIANSLNDVPEQFRDAAIADVKARTDQGGNVNMVDGLDDEKPAPIAPTPVETEAAPAQPGPVSPEEPEVRQDYVDGDDTDRLRRDELRHDRESEGETTVKPRATEKHAPAHHPGSHR